MLMVRTQFNVMPATPADVARMREIQLKHFIKLDSPENLNPRMKNGFFVTEVKDDKFIARITDTKQGLVLVARNNGQISGYALAYDLDCIRREEPFLFDTLEINEAYRKMMSGKKILYIDQIAKDPQAGGGVGSALLDGLEGIAGWHGYSVAAGLVMERRLLNMASARLMCKFDYERIGAQTLEPDAWGVFAKRLEKA